jgi:hypothetical protein
MVAEGKPGMVKEFLARFRQEAKGRKSVGLNLISLVKHACGAVSALDKWRKSAIYLKLSRRNLERANTAANDIYESFAFIAAELAGWREIALIAQGGQGNRFDVRWGSNAMQLHMRRRLPRVAIDHANFPHNRRLTIRAKPLTCRDLVPRTRSPKPHCPHQYRCTSSPE